MNTTIKRPQARTRKANTCGDWLALLEPSELRDRWPKHGAVGFYQHERLWIARYCPITEFRTLAQEQMREQADRQAERKAEAQRLRAEREAQRERDLATIREGLAGLKAETHGTVQEAALRASQLYLDGSVPRTLKQCIAIAASEHLVAWSAIQAYLAGVGVRVLWAGVSADDIWESGT